MRQPPPEIAVVIPTFRHPERLPRLVGALERQSFPADRFEVVVVDDGSGDDTPEVLAKLADATPLRLRPVVLERNAGPAAARNTGWASTSAPVVAFTDDDCVPDPEWLRFGLGALMQDSRIGIVQGATLKPEGPHERGRWTVFREIVGPTPWFEGCNLFLRREPLEQTGGFNEEIRMDSEDTWLGWAVLAAGWERGFDELATVRHDLSERGLRWHLRMGWRERITLRVAREFPDLQREGFWRPWALRPLNVAFAAGAVGTAIAVRRPVALLAWLPWWWMRRPPFGFHPYFRYLGEKWLVDAAVFAGMKVGAVKYRRFAL
jgi:glycosyltransferase involved in cell wall biosynthesis